MAHHRQEAIQNLFRWIQSKYGNIDQLMDASLPVLCRQDGQLHTHDLQRLFRHELVALHIKSYLDPSYAQFLGQELAESFRTTKKMNGNDDDVSTTTTNIPQARNWTISHPQGYLESSDVHTLGYHAPYNVAMSQSWGKKKNVPMEYYQGVLEELQQRKRCMRRIVVDSTLQSSASSSSLSSSWSVPRIPQLHPMDQLRLDLDELWPAGAGLCKDKIPSTPSNNNNNNNNGISKYYPLGGGLPRIMIGPTRWRQGFIHVDELAPLSISHGLFSANIYLQLPQPKHEPEDGDLFIWPLNVWNKLDWYRNAHVLSKLVSHDVLDQYELRKVLAKPVCISLDPGDLVILCVQRPHTAKGFQQGIRVSYQSFLQHSGPDARILMEV